MLTQLCGGERGERAKAFKTMIAPDKRFAAESRA